MSKDRDDQDATAAGTAPTTTAPLLRTLGDADAAVCTDGFCAVPAAEAATQPEAGTQTGADK